MRLDLYFIAQARRKHKTAVSLEKLYPYANFEYSNFSGLFKEADILNLELSIRFGFLRFFSVETHLYS